MEWALPPPRHAQPSNSLNAPKSILRVIYLWAFAGGSFPEASRLSRPCNLGRLWVFLEPGAACSPELGLSGSQRVGPGL